MWATKANKCIPIRAQTHIKGEAAKTRPPETLNCSKSKTCRAKKLKPYQSVYLIS